MDYFADIGMYAAIATYAVIVVWTLLARLRWLPKGLARPVRRPLLSLSLGLVVAILVGFAVPFILVGAMKAIFWLSFALVAGLGLWAFMHSDDDSLNSSESDSCFPFGRDYGEYDEDWTASRGRLPRV